jgi:hypothetical protein
MFTEYLGQKISLARFGTTVGGWRTELIDGTEMWKYKGSPAGQRVWKQIVAAPVWLAPPGTPVRTLIIRDLRSKTGYGVNLHELGPSYASAYGLVAAYHARFKEGDDGELEVQGDEGIRTHGSVDYMSIMAAPFHGCHRLHNHIAMRLMSFRARSPAAHCVGQKTVAYKSTVQNTARTRRHRVRRRHPEDRVHPSSSSARCRSTCCREGCSGGAARPSPRHCRSSTRPRART